TCAAPVSLPLVPSSGPLPPLLVLLIPRPPRSPLFPYTTLFRSSRPAWSTPAIRSCSCRRRRAVRSAPPSSAAAATTTSGRTRARSEEHTSELQSRENLVCRLLLEKKKDAQRRPQESSHPLTPPT